MTAGRPAQIILAAGALGVVGALILVAVVGPTLGSLIECGPLCSPDLSNIAAIFRLATPIVSIALAAGLLLWPTILVRPATLASGLLAVGWLGPVLQDSPPTDVTLATLSLLSATPFLLMPPVGPGAGRWARRAWMGTIVVALLLWLIDMSFSGFMQTTPVPPQMAFLAVSAVVLGAGLSSGYLHRLEGRGRTADATRLP